LELELLAIRHQVSVLRRQPQRSASAVLDRPAALGVALRDLAAMLGPHGVGQARNRNPVAPKGLPALLAAGITSPGTAQEEHTDP
jgi:hypothetical protein